MHSHTIGNDLATSLLNWRFWARFAWQDVVNANIRTHLGVVLYPMLAGVWILTISLLFGDLLGGGRDDFMAYVAVGYVVFTFLSGCITASYSVFSRNLKIIQNMPIGIMNFPLRETARFLFQMGLQSITVVVIFLFNGFTPSTALVFVPLALVILVVFGLSLTVMFAIIGTFLPDLAAFTGSFMRLLFFVTPIWWFPGLTGGWRVLVADINPITHFIRIFRYPLLEGALPPLSTLAVVTASTLLVVALSLSLFAATRRHILLRL